MGSAAVEYQHGGREDGAGGIQDEYAMAPHMQLPVRVMVAVLLSSQGVE